MIAWQTGLRHLGELKWLERGLGLLGVRLVIWLVIAKIFAPGVFLDAYNTTPSHDEHYFYMHEEAARRTILEYAQLPAWTPYFCGGTPALANPQATYMAPDFALRLLFGTGPGRRLAILLLLAVGMEGMFRLARRHNISPLGSLLAACAFSTSGWFPHFIQLGWLNFFVGFQLVPWAALCFIRSNEPASLRFIIPAGGFLGWMLLCGGSEIPSFDTLTSSSKALI